LYEQILELRITDISNEIISKEELWENREPNSKILLLCKRYNDILKRKALIEESAPEERTEEMSDIVEQIHTKTISYAEEILLALLSEFNIETKTEKPLQEEDHKQTEPEQKTEAKNSYIFKKIETSFAWHIITVISIILIFILFQFYIN
jgi:hypothetical protein